MNRARNTVQGAASDIQKSAGVAERSVESFSKSASSSSNFRPYAMLAASRGFENAADRANLLRGSLISLTAVAGGFGTALTANIILRYADTFTKLNNQIRVVSDSSADAASRFALIGDVATRSRSSLEATAILYTRIQKAAPTAASTDILGYVETIQKALALGGATAQEARSAAIQFSQAIASNRLGGEELRAILETPLGLELAKGLGVTIGKLREMGHAGELTSDVVLGALSKIRGSINEQFARSVLTVDQALTFVDNKLIEYIGNINKSYGATRLLSGAIVGIGNNLDSIIPTIAAVGGLFAAGFIGRLTANTGKNIFGRIREDAAAARDTVRQLSEQQEKLQRGLVGAEIQKNTLKATPSASFADTGAVADYRRATQALTKLDEQYIGVLDQRRQKIQEIASITAQMSPRAAKLTEDAIGAENRLNDALARQDQLRRQVVSARTAELGALGLSATTGQTSQAVAAARARINIEKQAVQAEADVTRQREALAAKQSQIADLSAAADQKAAQKRIESVKQLQSIEKTARALNIDRELQTLEARYAGLTVAQSGDQNAKRAIVEATAQANQYRSAIAGVSAELVGATAAATAYGQSKAFLARQLGSVIGLFGGPWGVAITAGIVGFGLMAAAAAKSAQETKAAGDIYEEFIRKQSQPSSGPVNREAIIAQSGSLQKQIAQSEERKKAFQEEIAGLQKWAQEFKQLQQATDPVDQLNRVLEVTGGNVKNIVEEVSLLRDTGEKITPLVEALEAAARGARGMEVDIKNANAELSVLGKSRTGPSDDIFDADAFFKAREEYMRGTRDLVEVAKIAAAGDSVAAAARKEYLEQLGKEGAVTENVIRARLREVQTLGQLKDALAAMRAERDADFKDQSDRAAKQITDLAEYRSGVQTYIQQTGLKAKGDDVAAAALKEYISLRQKGVEISYSEVLANEQAKESIDKQKEAFDKAKREAENFTERLKRMKEEQGGAFFGDVDREVLKLARTMKATAPEIAAYVAAIKSGDFSKAPQKLVELRDIELTKKAGESAREVVKAYGDWSQIAPLAREKQKELNLAVQNGAITSAQAKVAYADFLAGFQNYAWINKTAEAFGNFATEALMDFDKINDAFSNLVKSLKKIIIEELISTPFKNAIKGILASLLTPSGGAGFMGWLSSWLSTGAPKGAKGGFVRSTGAGGARIGAYAPGGLVRGLGGPTGDRIPAWLSDREFVVNARSTARHRPLLEAINSGIGRMSSGAPRGAAFARGGLVQGFASSERFITRDFERRSAGAFNGLSAMAARTPVFAPVDSKLEVIVENRIGAQVSAKDEPDGRGGRRSRIVIEELVGGTMRPGSAANRSMLGSLGARQQPRRRGE